MSGNNNILKENFKDFYEELKPLIGGGYLTRGNSGYNETPIGAMQMFDDDTAPNGWLVADGTVYNISDYPSLANHFERVHGSKNYYGGDGTTSFAVPDWQGEFFRASGTNSHENQGNGGAVGEHQDATKHIKIASDNVISHPYEGYTAIASINADTYNAGTAYHPNASGRDSSVDPEVGIYTSRPTNTSLLCCIKAVPAGINYSIEEQEIGTWIDGKKLYQCTWAGLNLSISPSSWTVTNIESTNIQQILFAQGTKSSAGLCIPLEANPTENNHTKVGILGHRADSGIDSITLQYTKTTD